jgi:opacity protein-like surface antigen
MKKIVFLLVLAALVTGGAFAQAPFRISVGAGGLIGGDFGGGAKGSASFLGVSMSEETKTPYFGGGGFAFVDLTYAELSLGILGGGGTAKMTQKMGGQSQSFEYDVSLAALNIGLLGKYPFTLNEKLSLFPLLGIEYRAVLSAKIDGEKVDDPVDLSALWFKFGGGLDYSFTDNIYLRFEALYGIRIRNKFEKDMKNILNDQLDIIKAAGGSGEAKTRLGHGLTAALALGYRF